MKNNGKTCFETSSEVRACAVTWPVIKSSGSQGHPSFYLMDLVHFQDLNLAFDRTDPYLFFDISYDAFGLVSMVTEL